ncbi:uncharacterized protein LOC110452038 [Mizuhopecten yessoensis]|uniref:uncharacterized protein LOC110452038 n=1 Tax=Mizuhopecten yessoensis TaxID=6573 RepID=UPI000B45EE50|nr:uncharacterized protein LOC110452038 [Mizuhopecten yessoensis]
MSDGSTRSDHGGSREVKLLSTIGAKDLVKLGHVTKSGWLKRKTLPGNKRLSIGTMTWRSLFCCVSEGCMYHFESNTSKNPKTVFVLTGYNRVFRVDHQQRVNCFEIQPPVGVNSLKTYMFSCESDDDRLDWMKSIHDALLVANQQLPPDRHILMKFGYPEVERSVLVEAPTSGYSNIDELQEKKTQQAKPKTVERYNPWDQVFKEKSGSKKNKKTKQSEEPKEGGEEHVYMNEENRRLYMNQLGKLEAGQQDQGEEEEEEEEEEEQEVEEDYLFESSDASAARALLKDLVIQTFLVRNSREQGRKVLVVKRKDEYKQHKISINGDIFCVEAAEQFRSLSKLIEYYKQNELCGSCLGNGYKYYER